MISKEEKLIKYLTIEEMIPLLKQGKTIALKGNPELTFCFYGKSFKRLICSDPLNLARKLFNFASFYLQEPAFYVVED